MHTKQDIKIVRLSEGDVRFESDHLKDLKHLIHASSPMYPGIEKWFSTKVLPGIKSQQRSAFVGYLDDKPIASAIAKKGAEAKICHLKISPELRQSNLGEIFFSLMGIELRQCAHQAYLTLPESLWETKHEFFESFGFEDAVMNDCQYRMFDEELYSSAQFSSLWHAILSKMPKLADLYSLGGFALDSKLIFSIQPRHSRKILSGEKKYELRRKFSEKWQGARINIYETAPTMALVGEATIGDIIHGSLDYIWDKFSSGLGCTKAEFDAYTLGLDRVYAIEINNVKPYRSGFFLMTASSMINAELRPPQSYFSLEKNKPWSQAVSLAAYLHGCFAGVSNFDRAAFSSLVPSHDHNIEGESVDSLYQLVLKL